MQHVQGQGYYQSKGHGEGEGRMKKKVLPNKTQTMKKNAISANYKFWQGLPKLNVDEVLLSRGLATIHASSDEFSLIIV